VKASLVLIASYPKSGNTWTRLVFDYLLRGGTKELSINELGGAVHGRARRSMFDVYSPVSSSDLTFEEIESVLPDMFRNLTAESAGVQIVKVHECSHRNVRGEWLFPTECVQAAVYLVRHPFDVAVSFANHGGKILADTIEGMASQSYYLPRQVSRLELPLPQWMGSWSENIESWIDHSPYRTAIARYEDLHERPEDEFARLVEATGFDFGQVAIREAVTASRFEVLQEQERKEGFRERPGTSAVFFRAGRPRTWEGLLTDEMRAKIVRDHGTMMKRLGYRDDGSIASMPEELRR